MADSAAAVPLFDRLEAGWASTRFRRASGSFLVAVFFLTLVAVEAARRGWLPPDLAEAVPHSHFAAVSFAFTLFLVVEVIGLVFALARSVANSVGKQFEVFSLILLREAFHEFSGLPEPLEWEAMTEPVLHMLADAGGALVIFFGIGVYYALQLHRPITADAQELSEFIRAKKWVALALLVTFVVIGVLDLWWWLTGQETYPFFDTFYTVLIFSDVLLVLISLRYTATFPVVFRNSGFAVATVLLRIALAAPTYVRLGLGVASVVFVVGLTFAYNRFAVVHRRVAEEEENGAGAVPGRPQAPRTGRDGAAAPAETAKEESAGKLGGVAGKGRATPGG